MNIWSAIISIIKWVYSNETFWQITYSDQWKEYLKTKNSNY